MFKVNLPVKLSELFSLIADNKQDIALVHKAKVTLYRQVNALIWNRIADVCYTGNEQNAVFARDVLTEVWIDILKSSFSISKILKKKYSSYEDEENHFLILVDKIIHEKKSGILSDNHKYSRENLLVNEFHNADNNEKTFEEIDECGGCDTDQKYKCTLGTIEKDENLPIDAEHDFIEAFVNEGKIKIENLTGEELKAIEKWFKIELVKLPKRDREIILEYFNIKGDRKNLDDEKIAYLCKRWRTTPSNLLKIRDKTFKKLEAAFLRYVEQEQERRKRYPGKEGFDRRA